MEELVKIDGIHWIRVHYFYAEAITDSLIETMAKHEKICNYIDLPVQHADDTILRRMARRTNRNEMTQKIQKIREMMPDAVIRTSIIVGFPGETQEQFETLCDFVKEIRFDRMGVFAYSQEEGTPAAEFEGQIDEDTKQERLDTLMKIQQQISLEQGREKQGKIFEVVVCGYDEESYLFYGRSRGDSIDVDGLVYFGAEEDVEVGDFVMVEILNSDEYDLMGRVVEEEK